MNWNCVNNMNPYFIWIPSLIILTALWAWMAKQVNMHPNSLLFYMLFLSIPVWGFVARISKNLLIDGFIYDVIMTLAYAGTFIFMGAAQGFTISNWLGVILTMIGIVLMKAA